MTGHRTVTFSGMATSLAELPLAQLLADLPETFFFFYKMSFHVKTLTVLAKWLRHTLLNQTDLNSHHGFNTQS